MENEKINDISSFGLYILLFSKKLIIHECYIDRHVLIILQPTGEKQKGDHAIV